MPWYNNMYIYTMEQFVRHVAEWTASLLDKRLKVNAGMSKVMVGSSGGKMIVNSGKWPHDILGKECRQTLFGAQYAKMDSQTVQWCAWWLFGVDDCFRCRQCDGTMQEADLAEDLVYGCVKCLCYLGDTCIYS